MSKRYIFAPIPAILLFAGAANAQHPMLDAVANRVVQKYQQSSCVVIAARWRGFPDDQAREMAVQTATSYRESMRKREGTGVLEAWYSRITVADPQALVGGNVDLGERVNSIFSLCARNSVLVPVVGERNDGARQRQHQVFSSDLQVE
jgi:Uncharacterized protein conserved in bacteria (DUF2252)